MPRTKQDQYTGVFRDIVLECLARIGKRFDVCELCGKDIKKFDIHHTKYEGATIYDLMIVCHKCNLQPENCNLV